MARTPEFHDKTDKTTNDLLKAFDIETPTPATKSEVEEVGKLLQKQLDGQISHEDSELYKKSPANEQSAHTLEALISKDNPKVKEVYKEAPSPTKLYVEQTEKPSDKTQVSDNTNEKHEKIADNVKTNDKGQITEIAYPDGTSRHFEYGQDGKMSGYTAPEGSHWTTKDGVTWTKDGGKDQIYGVFNVDKQAGTFTFLNANEGHATVCTADGKREEKGDLTPAICEFICGQKDSLETFRNEYFTKDEVDGMICNPKASPEATIAAAFLREAMKEKNQNAFFAEPELLKNELSSLDSNKMKDLYKNLIIGANIAQGFETVPIFPNSNDEMAQILKDAKPGLLGNEATLKPLKELATKPGGLDEIRNMIKDKGAGKYEVTFPGDSDNPITVDAPTLGETILSSYGPPDSQRQHPKFLSILEKAAGTYLNKNQNPVDSLAHAIQHQSTEARWNSETIIPADGLSYDPNGERISQLLRLSPKTEVSRKTKPTQPTQISYDDTNTKKDKPAIG